MSRVDILVAARLHGGGPVSGIFINYRGEDTQTAAALIDRELTVRFGSDLVFLASRSIPVGSDFAEELLGRVRTSSVLLVVIGPRWLTLRDEAGGRRIDDPQDWVRREIVEAFTHGLRVVPVLTDGARLPVEAELPGDIAGLSRRQYVPLRRRYTGVDLAFLAERITEADPRLAEAAARRQPSTGSVLPDAGASGPATQLQQSKRGVRVTERLDAMAEALAISVRAQWEAEERIRPIHDPFPLPVRWTNAADHLMDHWQSINGSPDRKNPIFLNGYGDGIVDTFSRIPSGRLVILGRAGAAKT